MGRVVGIRFASGNGCSRTRGSKEFIPKGRVESTRTGPRKKETLALVPGRGKESLEGSPVPRKERLNKEYDFDVDETESIFREHDKIKLPPCKRPSEEGKSADPKDCPFHRVPGHPIKDCFVLQGQD